MSIDVIIRGVEVTQDGAILLLEPRTDHPGAPPLHGLEKLLIEEPTWTPAPGMALWGNDATVIIETGSGQRIYRRVGDLMLREGEMDRRISRAVIDCHVTTGTIRDHLATAFAALPRRRFLHMLPLDDEGDPATYEEKKQASIREDQAMRAILSTPLTIIDEGMV